MMTLNILRFVMGLGLGAEIVVGYSTMTEFVPPRTRGRWLAFMSFIVVFGLPATALLGYVIIPNYGWRPMFVICGLGSLVVCYLRKSLPESPRCPETQGGLYYFGECSVMWVLRAHWLDYDAVAVAVLAAGIGIVCWVR
jgi:MFS transporter, putative metabolite:H+ symporter